MKLANGLKKVFVTALVLGWPIVIHAGNREGNVVNKSAQPIDFTQVIDLGDEPGNALSLQAIVSTVTLTTESIDTGSKSTGSITVVDYESLYANKAWVTITVSSPTSTALTDAVLTINGAPFREGKEWSIGSSTRATATSLSNAINGHYGFQSTHTLTAQAIITSSASTTGSFANSWAVTSSTPTALIVSAAKMSKGQDNASITIGTMTFVYGTDIATDATSVGTAAIDINDAIIARTSLILSTVNSGQAIVFCTSTYNGSAYNWPISVSSRTALTVSGNGLSMGLDTDVDVVNDQIYYPSHGLKTGTQILYHTNSGATTITGLTTGTTYYAIRIDDNNYKLATSSTLAVAGTTVAITGLVDAATAAYTIQPIAFSTGSAGFYWGMSNDGTNFSTYTFISPNLATQVIPASFNYQGISTNTRMWDFSKVAYRYLKIYFTGPTSGGLDVIIRMFSR